MHSLIFKSSHSKSVQISEWVSEMPFVGLNPYPGRLYLITWGGNGCWGLRWPQALCGLWRLSVSFTGVLQSTHFYSGHAVLGICYKSSHASCCFFQTKANRDFVCVAGIWFCEELRDAQVFVAFCISKTGSPKCIFRAFLFLSYFSPCRKLRNGFFFLTDGWWKWSSRESKESRVPYLVYIYKSTILTQIIRMFGWFF